MPVPTVLSDLSTTAGSNSPSGSETPGQGDDHLRAGYAFIAQLRDKLNGTSPTGTLLSPVLSGATGTLTGPTISSPTFTGTVTFPSGNHGTYTPTASNLGNLTSVTPSAAQWLRVGNTVTVGGSFIANVTAGGALTFFNLSLPIPSALSADNNLGGSGTDSRATMSPVFVLGDGLADLAFLQWYPNGSGSRLVSFTFTYLVI